MASDARLPSAFGTTHSLPGPVTRTAAMPSTGASFAKLSLRLLLLPLAPEIRGKREGLIRQVSSGWGPVQQLLLLQWGLSSARCGGACSCLPLWRGEPGEAGHWHQLSPVVVLKLLVLPRTGH